jgi:hypothetical protein
MAGYDGDYRESSGWRSSLEKISNGRRFGGQSGLKLVNGSSSSIKQTRWVQQTAPISTHIIL